MTRLTEIHGLLENQRYAVMLLVMLQQEVDRDCVVNYYKVHIEDNFDTEVDMEQYFHL
jgi:hypothetical protein